MVTAEVDIQATLKANAGRDIEDYLIVDVCDPSLAYRALLTDRQAGLVMSSRVVVRAIDSGTAVEVIDPDALVGVVGRVGLRSVADELRQRLTVALDSLRDATPAST
jgi:uncharacterized protein (DUF302 family)